MPSVASEIRPTTTPVHCSGCFGQYPDRQHIDFDAACDRGYGGPDKSVSMDELVLCEECVRTGATLLGMIDAEEWKAERARLEARLEEAEALRRQAVDYANRMEEALAARPQRVSVSRPRGRPRNVPA